MQLHYHVSDKNNFGDAMNPWFWEKIFPDLLNAESKDYICGIGTILNSTLPRDKPLHILGSGFGYSKDNTFKLPSNAVAHFVRGPLSAKSLKLTDKQFICDPGLLISDLHEGVKKKIHSIGFIPHESIHSASLEALFANTSIIYINPCLPYKDVFNLISSCEKLVCSAMHGAIIADSYRVPWLPVITSNEILQFKWQDWCLSMGINYNPKILPTVYPKTVYKGLVGNVRAKVKRYLFTRKMNNLLSSDDFVLSSEDIFVAKKEKLYQKFAEFRKTFT